MFNSSPAPWCASWVRKLPAGVGTTAGVNLVVSILSAGTGLVLAKVLGAYGRGGYAAANAWFGAALVIGELGLTGATTYFVAREPARAGNYVTTTRRLLAVQGVVVAGLLIAVAPLLGRGGSGQTLAYVILFAIVPVAFLSGPYTFALQSLSIRRWNAARLSQPVLYVLLLAGLWVFGTVTLVWSIVMLAISIAGQFAFAWALYRSLGLRAGYAQRDLVRPLLTYGVSTLAASAPTVANARLDQVVLALVVPRADLGQYALAVSIASFSFPLGAAFGYVAMPQLARLGISGSEARRGIAKRALGGSAAVALLTTVPILAGAWLLTPLVFGDQYRQVPLLVLILTPGAMVLAVKQVAGDLLRGMGRPSTVARCEGAAAAVTVLGLAISLPNWGIYGAAVTSVLSYMVAFALLLTAVLRAVRSDPTAIIEAPTEQLLIDPDPTVLGTSTSVGHGAEDSCTATHQRPDSAK